MMARSVGDGHSKARDQGCDAGNEGGEVQSGDEGGRVLQALIEQVRDGGNDGRRTAPRRLVTFLEVGTNEGLSDCRFASESCCENRAVFVVRQACKQGRGVRWAESTTRFGKSNPVVTAASVQHVADWVVGRTVQREPGR